MNKGKWTSAALIYTLLFVWFTVWLVPLIRPLRLIPAENMPEQALELLEERVVSGEACTPVPGPLEFDPPRLLHEKHFYFLTGEFTAASQTRYRYRVRLRKIPILSFYLYDTSTDFPFKNVSPYKPVYSSSLDGALFRYEAWVWLNRVEMRCIDVTPGLAVPAAAALWIGRRYKKKKGAKRQAG